MKFSDTEIFEKECVYEAGVDVAHFNENHILKPHAYQMIFAEIVGDHLNRFEANMSTTMRYGLAWALISQSYEIKNPIRDCMKLYARTWFSGRRGPYFRREAVFCNEAGDVMFHAASFSILLELESRGIFRKRETPFHMDPPHEELLMDADPSFRANLAFTDMEERKVYNSYIDRLGHVNNCRYGEFAYDVFTEDEKVRLADLSRMDAYFISEMRNHDVFTIQKAAGREATGDDHRIAVKGKNITKDDIAFAMVFDF